jgi:hypothetical protein
LRFQVRLLVCRTIGSTTCRRSMCRTKAAIYTNVLFARPMGVFAWHCPKR